MVANNLWQSNAAAGMLLTRIDKGHSVWLPQNNPDAG
jgi:hypothetical protein